MVIKICTVTSQMACCEGGYTIFVVFAKNFAIYVRPIHVTQVHVSNDSSFPLLCGDADFLVKTSCNSGLCPEMSKVVLHLQLPRS